MFEHIHEAGSSKLWWKMEKENPKITASSATQDRKWWVGIVRLHGHQISAKMTAHSTAIIKNLWGQWMGQEPSVRTRLSNTESPFCPSPQLLQTKHLFCFPLNYLSSSAAPLANIFQIWLKKKKKVTQTSRRCCLELCSSTMNKTLSYSISPHGRLGPVVLS